MKPNYPVERKGGISQQPYEARTKIQRTCVKSLLKSAGVKLEGLRTTVDLGCRNGDTTLGILEVTSDKTRIIGVEEYKEALLIAKAKFGVASSDEIKQITGLLGEMPDGFLDSFEEDTKPFRKRAAFVNSPVEGMPTTIADRADLIVGFQILHWLNAGDNGLPAVETMKAINESLAAGGIFLSGTSTAFIAISPDEEIDGKKKSEYSIDGHPFVKTVYEKIAGIVSKITGHEPQPVTEKPPLSMDSLMEVFENAGFKDIKTGAFLVTSGREEVIREVVKLRPEHQGRLNGIDSGELREDIIDLAIESANNECDLLAGAGKGDPRLVETNIWDAVPYIMATKK